MLFKFQEDISSVLEDINMDKTIRVARSFVVASALAEKINAEYDLGGLVNCKLFSKMLRTQDNDHYLVSISNGDQYVARIYQEGTQFDREESDYLYELDWLLFLKENDLPVSYPIPRRDGSYLGSVLAPEGVRYFALFTLARGQTLSVKDPEKLWIMGNQIAQIHVASNDFKTEHRRLPIDLTALVDKPVERIKAFFVDENSQKLEFMLIAAEEAKSEIQSLIDNIENTSDAWGPIGGDFHQSSVFFNSFNQPTFFNFDHCGPGWRSYDIAAFLFNSNLMHQSNQELSEAFFAGYFSVRQLSDNEHASISSFLTIRRIWHTGLFALTEGLAGHTFIAPL